MAYYVNPAMRMAMEVSHALDEYFGRKATHSIDKDNVINVKFSADAGYPVEVDPCEDPDVFGGGLKAALDGLDFDI
jgi:hypothetical protein